MTFNNVVHDAHTQRYLARHRDFFVTHTFALSSTTRSRYASNITRTLLHFDLSLKKPQPLSIQQLSLAVMTPASYHFFWRNNHHNTPHSAHILQKPLVLVRIGNRDALWFTFPQIHLN